MQPSHPLDLLGDPGTHRVRQHREASLPSFPLAHVNATPSDIHVFHPQRETLHEPQPRAVQQRHREPMGGHHRGQETRHLCRHEHVGRVAAPARARNGRRTTGRLAEHIALEKQQCRVRLVERARGNPALSREPLEKPPHVRRARLARVPEVTESHEPYDP